MNYDFNGKRLRIPDDELQSHMKTFNLTHEEAIQLWLEDEGYIDNEEQEALEKKAKENRITATIHQAKATEPKKKTQKERVQKEDATKEMIIQKLAEFLPDFVENVQVLNKSKLISFRIGADDYEIDLKRKRKPKK